MTVRFATVLSALSLCALASSCVDEVSIGVAQTGTNSAAIVDGHQASANEISATVGLLGNFTCSGTLIAPRVVMTAAHCVVDGINGVNVYAGILNENNAGNANRYSIAQSIPHPNYNPNAWDSNDPDGLALSNDIAVLLLDRDVTQAQPVPILPQARLNSDLNGGEPLTLAGFGTLSENGNSTGTLYVTQTPFMRRSATELLAGGPNQPDSCYGDSGGPAYRDVNGERFVVGVTSRGSSGGSPECGNGGIYTLAPAFISWINDVSGGLMDGTTPPPVVGTDPEPNPGLPPDSTCLDRCDEDFDEDFDEDACFCDADCVEFEDCCPDFVSICIDGNIPEPPPPAEPDATEPEATEPDATEPEATEPEAAQPDATEPEATEPETAQPDATEPDVVEPDASQPDVAEPDASPDVVEPDAVAVGPEGVTDPESPSPDGVPDNSAGAVRSRPQLTQSCNQTSSTGLLPFALLALFLRVRRRQTD